MRTDMEVVEQKSMGKIKYAVRVTITTYTTSLFCKRTPAAPLTKWLTVDEDGFAVIGEQRHAYWGTKKQAQKLLELAEDIENPPRDVTPYSMF